jgi:hypothetical protein
VKIKLDSILQGCILDTYPAKTEQQKMTLSQLFKIAEKADTKPENTMTDRRGSLCYMDVNTPEYRKAVARINKEHRK